MLIEVPDRIARTAEQEARRTGRSLGELVVDLLRGAFGISEQTEAEDTDELLELTQNAGGTLDEAEAESHAVSAVRAFRQEKARAS